jgi:hypothetical protein
MSEEWKAVLGFEDRYLISDQGNCVRILTRGGRSMWRSIAGRIEGNGYVTLCLYNQRAKQTHPLAHRVVWQAFCGPILKGLEVNHKNGIKFDNRLENLELATRSENMLHGFRELGFSRKRLQGEQHPKAKLGPEDVLKILDMRGAGIRRQTVADKFNVSFTAIRLIEMGQNWSHLTNLAFSSKPAFTSPTSRGSGNGCAKLTEDDIPKIFAMNRSGVSQRKIAVAFGISQGQIGRILLGKRWKHLSGIT